MTQTRPQDTTTTSPPTELRLETQILVTGWRYEVILRYTQIVAGGEPLGRGPILKVGRVEHVGETRCLPSVGTTDDMINSVRHVQQARHAHERNQAPPPACTASSLGHIYCAITKPSENPTPPLTLPKIDRTSKRPDLSSKISATLSPNACRLMSCNGTHNSMSSQKIFAAS